MVNSHAKTKLEDPVYLLYRSYIRKFRNWCILSAIALAAACFLGVPHMQWTYTYNGPERLNVESYHKTSAWYVSVTGWKQVRNGQYGPEGCPTILFIPILECFGTQSPSE